MKVVYTIAAFGKQTSKLRAVAGKPQRSTRFFNQNRDDCLKGDKVVGSCQCVDGVTRAVYEEADGRQYVYGRYGKVHGAWLLAAA